MDVLYRLPKPFFVLAPMDDVTDTVFRQIVAACGRPDLFYTEFVNVDGLQSVGRDKLMHRIQYTKAEQPIIAQVWGKQPEHFYKTAQELVAMGFKGIDLNMGCPVKAVVNNGCCSALIDNRDLAIEIIKATQQGAAGRVPVSVKTRLGSSQIDFTWHELLLRQNLSMLTIHGRTRKQMSAVSADWEAIGRVRKLRDALAPHTLIVGNGDVATHRQGVELAKKYQLDGIMIGRGVFHDPFIFSKDSPWNEYTKRQRIELYTKHVKLFAQTWNHQERRIVTLNKFCKVYVNGFDGAKELRERLMQAQSSDELLAMLAAGLK
ncbi:MAG TPA: tRNA-dihydrouridine synthase [Candidatus Saccharimonadales bacterium]|nr:tRNA-dihydrouridine synthase [Candidatus Saccharimonadales bacterium]